MELLILYSLHTYNVESSQSLSPNFMLQNKGHIISCAATHHWNWATHTESVLGGNVILCADCIAAVVSIRYLHCGQHIY